MGKEIEETAKAVQEVAKTSGQAIEATREAGGFVAKLLGPALEHVSGGIEDRAALWRLKTRLIVERRVEELWAQHGMSGPARLPAPGEALRFLHAASMEDHAELRELFARLLFNATRSGSEITLKRAYIDILRQCEPADVRMLSLLYAAPLDPDLKMIFTALLPEEYVPPERKDLKGEKPRHEVELVLWNLCRLRCVEPCTTWGGVMSVGGVIVTPLGRALVEACNVPDPPDHARSQDHFRGTP